MKADDRARKRAFLFAANNTGRDEDEALVTPMEDESGWHWMAFVLVPELGEIKIAIYSSSDPESNSGRVDSQEIHLTSNHQLTALKSAISRLEDLEAARNAARKEIHGRA